MVNLQGANISKDTGSAPVDVDDDEDEDADTMLGRMAQIQSKKTK
jgi:hypothetical protein